MQNCVDRFMDANESVLRHLSAMQAQGQTGEGGALG